MREIFKIDNNSIFITRGNSGEVCLSIIDINKTPYKLEEDDRLLLSVKKGCDYSEVLICKDYCDIVEYDAGDATAYKYIFSFEPSDTAELEFGNYVYDIILYFANGDANTVVNTSLFRVCRAVGS